MEMGEPVEQTAKAERWRHWRWWRDWSLAVLVGVLAYCVIWMAYLLGSVFVFAVTGWHPPLWEAWPVRLLFGAAAAGVVIRVVARRKMEMAGNARWVATAACALVLGLLTPLGVAQVGESRFLAGVPATWDKQEALELGHRQCAWFKVQPWGEPGGNMIFPSQAEEMAGHELTRRGLRETRQVLRRAEAYLCPFQRLIHRHHIHSEYEGD